jgi:hypothetical protein
MVTGCITQSPGSTQVGNGLWHIIHAIEIWEEWLFAFLMWDRSFSRYIYRNIRISSANGN